MATIWCTPHLVLCQSQHASDDKKSLDWLNAPLPITSEQSRWSRFHVVLFPYQACKECSFRLEWDKIKRRFLIERISDDDIPRQCGTFDPHNMEDMQIPRNRRESLSPSVIETMQHLCTRVHLYSVEIKPSQCLLKPNEMKQMISMFCELYPFEPMEYILHVHDTDWFDKPTTEEEMKKAEKEQEQEQVKELEEVEVFKDALPSTAKYRIHTLKWAPSSQPLPISPGMKVLLQYVASLNVHMYVKLSNSSKRSASSELMDYASCVEIECNSLRPWAFEADKDARVYLENLSNRSLPHLRTLVLDPYFKMDPKWLIRAYPKNCLNLTCPRLLGSFDHVLNILKQNPQLREATFYVSENAVPPRDFVQTLARTNPFLEQFDLRAELHEPIRLALGKLLKRHERRNRRLERLWGWVCIVLAFIRAQSTSAIQFSILPLVPTVLEMAFDSDVSVGTEVVKQSFLDTQFALDQMSASSTSSVSGSVASSSSSKRKHVQSSLLQHFNKK